MVVYQFQANYAVRKRKVVFLINWKCGSSSILEAIAGSRLDEPTVRRYTLPRIPVKDIPSDWLRIALVRHPLTRLQSCWKEKVRDNPNMVVLEHLPDQKPCDFETFVECIAAVPDERADLHFRSQYYSMFNGDKPCWDVLVKLEELDERWPEIQQRVLDHSGWEMVPIGHHGKTEDAPAYNDETWALAVERYALDFHYFEYEYDV